MKVTNRMIKLTTHRLRLAFGAGLLVCLIAMSALAADVKPAIDPQAAALLQRMSDYLA